MSILKRVNAKFLGIIAILVAVFALGACEPSPAVQARREASDRVNEALTKILFANYDEVVNSFTLVKRNATYGVDFAWETSDEEVIRLVDAGDAIDARVKRPNFEDGNKTVVLTVTASREYSYIDKDGYETTDIVSVTKEFEFTVLALREDETILTIAEVKDPEFELDKTVGIQGIVTGLFSDNRGGFFVTDDTGTIYVYASYEEGKLNLGDEVVVYGVKGNYYGSTQVTKPSGGQVSYSVVSNGNPLPEPEEISVSEIALTDKADPLLPGSRFRTYALLTYVQEGSYWNYYLSDPHTGDKIQLYYRGYIADQTNLADFVDEYVNITITVYYYDDRIPMWTCDYSETEGSIELAEAPSFTDEDKAELVEKDLAKLFGDLTATSLTTVTLPAENTAYGATIVWEALDDNAVIEEGVLTWQVVAEASEAKVKVSITVGEYTLVKEYVITVKPLIPVKVADFLAAENDELVVLEGIVFRYNQGAYLVDDNGDSVLLYYFTTEDYENGDRVIVIGKRSEFNYTPQMQSAELIQVVSKGNANPLTPIQMTIEEIHAVDFKTTDLWGSYIQVEGTVIKDPSDNRYYALEDANGNHLALYQSNTTVLAQLKDQKVVLNLWFYGISKTDGTGIWRMVFAGNEGEYQVADMTVEEKLQAVASALPVKENQEITSNLVLPLTGAHDATIAWESDNEDVLTAEGVVTRGAEDVTVKLTATITIGEEELVVDINVIVKAEVTEILTVEEFLALEKGATATVKGYVYKYDDGSYIVSEDGVAVLAYKFKDADHGDLVVVSGKKDEYNGTPQFASGAVLEDTISKGNAIPLTAVPMTIAEIVTSDYPGANLFGQYFEVTGTIVPDGGFYGIEADGKLLSLYYSNVDVLADLLDLEVTLKVIFYGNSKADGSGFWRAVFAGYEGEYTVPELTPEQKIAAAKAEVQIVDGQNVAADLVLPTTGKYDVAITWVSDNAAINAETGVVTRGAEDVTVVLTATFAIDGVEEEVEYTVVVLAESEGEVVTVEAKYEGSETTNMESAPANNAATIGLDQGIFTVLSIKNSPGQEIGLNKAGQIRIYTDRNDGNGNTLKISIADGYKITKIEFEFGASTNNPIGKLVLGAETHNLGTSDLLNTTKVYDGLDITTFSLQNTQTGGSKNAQIYILSIKITYAS